MKLAHFTFLFKYQISLLIVRFLKKHSFPGPTILGMRGICNIRRRSTRAACERSQHHQQNGGARAVDGGGGSSSL